MLRRGGLLAARRWSLKDVRRLRAMKMFAGGELKGGGTVSGTVTELLARGELRGLAVERVVIRPRRALTPHYHRRTEAFLMFVKGRGIVTLNGRRVAVREGHAMYVPPGTAHGFVTAGAGLEFLAVQRPPVYVPGKGEDLVVARVGAGLAPARRRRHGR